MSGSNNNESELHRLRLENEALLDELNLLKSSLRLRFANAIVQAFKSPKELLKLPKLLWEFLNDASTIRKWQRIVLGLDCGLPEDPLKNVPYREMEKRDLNKLIAIIFSPPTNASPGALKAGAQKAADRLCELQKAELGQLNFHEDEAEDLNGRGADKSILMALHTGEPDVINGYSRRSQEILKQLRRDGWQVAGALRQGRSGYGPAMSDGEVDGVPYLRLPLIEARQFSLRDYVLGYSAAIETLARRKPPSIIHAASNHITGNAAALAAKRLGTPFVYEVRGLWEVTRETVEPSYRQAIGYRAQRQLEIQAAKSADRVLANGEALAELLCAAGVPENNIRLAPNGCNHGDFTSNEDDIRTLRNRWSLTGCPVIGFVGSLTPYEGLEELIRACAELPASSYRLLIIGDGAARAQLEQTARSLLNPSTYMFTGRVSPDEARAAYGLIDIAYYARPVSPVANLTPPLKPLEAMAAGAALIVSTAKPLKEFAADGRAVVADPTDRTALSTALKSLLSNENQRRTMTEKARAWVIEYRSWPSIVREIEKVYEELI